MVGLRRRRGDGGHCWQLRECALRSEPVSVAILVSSWLILNIILPGWLEEEGELVEIGRSLLHSRLLLHDSHVL